MSQPWVPIQFVVVLLLFLLLCCAAWASVSCGATCISETAFNSMQLYGTGSCYFWSCTLGDTCVLASLFGSEMGCKLELLYD